MTVEKSALRALAAARRAEAFAAQPDAGERLAELFPSRLIPPRGAVVSGCWPFRSEIDPRPLMRRLAATGASLALPCTPPRGSDSPLSFRLWDEAHALLPGHFGVHEPPAHAELVQPDLVLCPLLAFDGFGARLGYGQGHYDRALAALRAVKPVTAIGLAFSAQEMERLPAEPHDAPLDGIVTEIAYIDVMRTAY